MKTTITKKEVAKRTAKIVGEKIYLTEKIIDGVFAALREFMGETNPEIRIEIRGFGVFEVRTIKTKPKARQQLGLKARNGFKIGTRRRAAPNPLQEVREKLDSLFKPEEGQRWLYAPNAMFEGRRPIDLITHGEADRIMQILVRIEQGIHN